VAGDVLQLQQLVMDHLGLAPSEEARQMLHYVIPQVCVRSCARACVQWAQAPPLPVWHVLCRHPAWRLLLCPQT
jgi:hypothetical protein